MNVALAAAVAAVSAFLIDRLGLPSRVGEVMGRARRCREILADSDRTDLEKERALREEAIRLFGLFGRLAGGSALALGAPLAAVAALGAAGVGSPGGVVATMVRPAFLAGAFGLGGLVYAWRWRARR